MNRRTSPPSLARQIKRPQRGLTEGAEAFEASENHRKERDRLYRLQKNSIQGKVLKGHDFSRAANAPQRSSASAAAGCLPRFLSPQKISSMGTPCVRIGLQSYRKTPLKRVGLHPLRDVVSESAQARFGRDAAGSGRGRAPGTTPPASSERSRSNRKVQRSGVGTNYRNNSNTSEGVIEICAHPRWWENEDKNKDGLPAGETGCLVIPSMEAVWDRILCKSRTYLGCS